MKITINIPDKEYKKVLDAFCLVSGVPKEEDKDKFLKDKIVEFITQPVLRLAMQKAAVKEKEMIDKLGKSIKVHN